MIVVGARVDTPRRRDRGSRLASGGVVVAAAAVLALSFAGLYSYRVTSPILQICALSGGPPCPDTTITRTAWHGPWSAAAVGVALLAGLLAAAVLDRPARRRDLALLTIGVSAVAGACLVAAGRAIPHVADVSAVLHDLGGPSTRLRYGDLVDDSLGWPYWASLVVAAAGFGSACLALVLDRARTPRA